MKIKKVINYQLSIINCQPSAVSHQKLGVGSWEFGVGSWGLGVKLFVLALIVSRFIGIHCYLQNSGIGINANGAAPNIKTLLDINASGMNPKAGVLIPRMTTLERNLITTPIPESLMIYNTDTHCFEAYYNGGWVGFGCLSSCGSPLIDSRDGQSYSTVQIGAQCWMAQNLNYGSFVTEASGQGASGTQKYCYDDNTANCVIYGGLYTWAEIMNGESSSNNNPSGVTGICPSGWHLPSDAEWCQLENQVEPGTDPNCNLAMYRGTNTGGDLKQAGFLYWASPNTGATNSSGFTALPAGSASWSGGFMNMSGVAYFWTSTAMDATHDEFRGMSSSDPYVYRSSIGGYIGSGFSVRCVKN